MDNLAMTVLAAGAGASFGALGTWWTDRLRDRQRDQANEGRSLQAKIHDLELRMVRLETEFGYYAGVGAQRLEGVAGAQQD